MGAEQAFTEVVFFTWFMLSIYRQIRKDMPTWLRAIDPPNLIASWRLFGPRPIRVDYRIFFRDLISEDSYTAWVEVTPHRQRTIISMLWNPDRLLRKMLYTHIKFIKTELGEGSTSIDNHPSVEAIRHYVYHLPPASKAMLSSLRQFVLTTSQDLADPKTVTVFYESGWYHIDLTRQDLVPARARH